jgi:hypothetical protein
MPGKTQDEARSRSEQLAKLFDRWFGEVEAVEAASSKARSLIELARFAHGISRAESAEHQARASAARADAAIARAERLYRGPGRTPDPAAEGDVMEMDGPQDGDDSPEHLEPLRAHLSARFGEIAHGLERAGLLADVIALAAQCPEDELGHELWPEPAAA